MKRLTLALLFLAGMASCSKTEEKPPVTNEPYKCTSCITAPEAKAEHNNSSAGVYKGVLVGSTGIIVLYLNHTGTEVKAVITFDGQQATLSSTSFALWQPGKAVKQASFTGTVGDKNVEAIFSVDSNGQSPEILVTIPGHNMMATIYKETSAAIVKNFEGAYEGHRKGTLNLTVNGNLFSVASSYKIFPMTGTIVNGKIEVTHEGFEVNGTINGDEASGTWRDNYNNVQGTWLSKRTL